jgi:hypothetical protein
MTGIFAPSTMRRDPTTLPFGAGLGYM